MSLLCLPIAGTRLGRPFSSNPRSRWGCPFGVWPSRHAPAVRKSSISRSSYVEGGAYTWMMVIFWGLAPMQMEISLAELITVPSRRSSLRTRKPTAYPCLDSYPLYQCLWYRCWFLRAHPGDFLQAHDIPFITIELMWARAPSSTDLICGHSTHLYPSRSLRDDLTALVTYFSLPSAWSVPGGGVWSLLFNASTDPAWWYFCIVPL